MHASSPSEPPMRSAGRSSYWRITDVRGDVLRMGFGIYQDGADVERLAEMLREIG